MEIGVCSAQSLQIIFSNPFFQVDLYNHTIVAMYYYYVSIISIIPVIVGFIMPSSIECFVHLVCVSGCGRGVVVSMLVPTSGLALYAVPVGLVCQNSKCFRHL